MNIKNDTWNSGDPYEYFMGRWSKLMAPVFLDWLDLPDHLAWLDLGCGTGALSEAIYNYRKPISLACVEPSHQFLEITRQRLSGKAGFAIGGASKIPGPKNSFDVVVSGLALNFFPDLPAAFSEMKRVLKPNGTVAAYVWDYAGQMQFLRVFWDAACELDPAAKNFDEGIRFPICNPVDLEVAFRDAGLSDIQGAYLTIDTVFKDFDDYWNPFLGGQGPAPGYLASLSEDRREELQQLVHKKLQIAGDGTISLWARAIAIRGCVSV